MVYRDRQGLSSSGDPNQSSTNRDRYLDNCFLLCLNRGGDDDNGDVPEIHRLENHLMREICQKNPLNQSRSQQRQRGQDLEDYPFDEDEEDLIISRQQKGRDYNYRRRADPSERDSRYRYQRDDGFENYSNQDPYSRTARFNQRDNYNIMQHGDDELSVYEIYVPTNTLNRLSDKRIDNNMVLVDYEDVSALRDMRGPTSSYGYPTRNIPSQYSNYPPLNQYNEYGPQYQYDPSAGYQREYDNQRQFYQNQPPPPPPPPPQQQERFGDYYGNDNKRVPYPPQSGPFLPANAPPVDHSNAINVRRHIYSPSQLPQGLTEGQLVMLLQKGSQYQQQIKSGQPTQLFPSQNEPAVSSVSAVTVSHQPTPVSSSHVEPFKNPEYAAPNPQIKFSQVPPKIIDHQLADEDRSAVADETTKPTSALNTINAGKSSKEDDEKKKEKSSDAKKEKKAENAGDTDKKESKKDGKKEKSSGKDGKKKKK